MHSRSRLFLPLLFIVGFTTSTAAQEKGLVTGLIAGFNISSFAGEDAKEFNPSDVGSQPSTDFSILIGAGAQVGNAMFSVRYDLGLTDLQYTDDAQKVKNRVLQLTASYGFRVRQ